MNNNQPNILERYTLFIQQETLATKIICYGIASVGLFGALYRIRPFAKFRRPADIPRHFIQKQIPQKGTVVRIEPTNGTSLLVDHRSLLPLPRFSNESYLPVKLAGIDVTMNGTSWLQTIVNSRKIVFIPISKTQNYVDCIVELQEDNKKCLNVAEELVRLGFGTINQSALKKTDDKYILAYNKSLSRAQKWAQFRRNGYWQFARYPTLLWKLQMFCTEKLESVLPVSIIKQLNI